MTEILSRFDPTLVFLVLLPAALFIAAWGIADGLRFCGRRATRLLAEFALCVPGRRGEYPAEILGACFGR